MDFPANTIVKPFINKLIALQSFFFSRPRLDVDLVNDPTSLFGQKSLGPSNKQNQSQPIAVPDVIYDFEFYWNYKLRIKNNSSKTAYGIKIEKIFLTENDYLERIDNLAALKENETIELDYKLRHRASMTGNGAKQFLKSFPSQIEKIEILISYTNEARKRFYTKFKATKNEKINEHLLTRPKE